MEQHPITDADYNHLYCYRHVTSGLLKFESSHSPATTVLDSTNKHATTLTHGDISTAVLVSLIARPWHYHCQPAFESPRILTKQL